MKTTPFIVVLLLIAVAVFAQSQAYVVLLVEKETVENITDDGVTIATNITNRYVYRTQADLPQINYQNALDGYQTNTPAVTVSNDIARDVAGFYQRARMPVGSVEVRMP